MEPNLFQSARWAAFQEKSGRRVHILPAGLVGGVAVVESLPLVGNYLYFPRGPILETNTQYPISNIKETLLSLVRKEQAGWIRVEPEHEEGVTILKEIFGKQIVRSPRTVQPQEILVISLEGTSEERLARMKSKTRYNIRLAEKHGVAVRFSREEKDIEAFLTLIQATTKRKGIRPHRVEYYRNFFSVFGEGECVLALAEHEGDLLAAGLIVFYAGTAYYLHGGSNDTKRDLMAPFLLHYRAMEEAQQRGCSWYDFGGVATGSKLETRNSKLSDWAGITRFKQGFAPDTPTTLYPGTFDIIFDAKRYRLYRLLSRVQQIKRKIFA